MIKEIFKIISKTDQKGIDLNWSRFALCILVYNDGKKVDKIKGLIIKRGLLIGPSKPNTKTDF